MFKPDFIDFEKMARDFQFVPVYSEILTDMETPISMFKKVALRQKSCFLLESVEGGEKFGRYSFIGINPFSSIMAKNGKVYLEDREVKNEKDVLSMLKKFMRPLKQASMDKMPPFLGGAVGYLSYDYVRKIEKIPQRAADDLNLPEALFIFMENVIVFDHVKHKAFIIHNSPIGSDVYACYKNALKRIKTIKALMHKKPDGAILKSKSKGDLKITSNFKKENFINAVNSCKKYILNGDIFQVVLSQRWKIPIEVDDFELYRALRMTNPSPYMFFFKTPKITLVGASPEILVKLTGNEVCVRPIAGTRKRGINDLDDKALEAQLLSDEKERAEHVMLVDLGRNDIGRVCIPGTVKVKQNMVVEKYSHVMHIVSDVAGELKPGNDCFDLFRACFPAGTVSGAPKVRAMEIIDELEPTRRGPYAGALGYFSLSGDMDTCIIIRTIFISNNFAYVQAGAGIVADSVGEYEYKETQKKAGALFDAIELANKGLL